MSLDERRILAVLQDHVSPLNAQAMLGRARQQLDASGALVTMPALVAQLQRGGALFARDSGALVNALGALAQGHAGSPRGGGEDSTHVVVATEADVSRARMAARDVCQAQGARRLKVQQLTTVVSELARNIVLYTPGGSIELRVEGSDSAPELTIVARDGGAGIPELDAILAGDYRSRTGMGKGLLGVRRLMDTFDIETGPTGTTITTRASLS